MNAQKTASPAVPVEQTTYFFNNSNLEKRMKSRPLGTQNVPKGVIKEVANAFAPEHQNGFYDAYGSSDGVWTQIILANKDGDADDGQSYEYDARCKFTCHIEKLPKTKKWLLKHVNLDEVRSIRIFVTYAGGMIVTHRDYLEFKDGFDRVHIPLVTNPKAVNSENDLVYHMNVGEVWMLVGEEPHSALNDSEEPRLHLVIDYVKGCPQEDMFNRSLGKVPKVSFKYREFITDTNVDALTRMAQLSIQDNFKNTRDVVNRLHFYNWLPATFTYEVLLKAAEAAGSQELIEQALATRKEMIGA